MTMSYRPLAVAALALTAVLSACAAPPRPRASVAASAACRSQTEQVFNRQNRDLLTHRSSVDTPFSDSYDSGITSAGLSRQFERDQMMKSCLDSSSRAESDGASFSPAAARKPTSPTH